MTSRTSRGIPEMTMWLWLVFILPSTCGINIIDSVAQYHSVIGSRVDLGCHFTLAREELGTVEIQWTFKGPDSQEKLLLRYKGESLLDLTGSKGRIRLAMLDPQDGDASLRLKKLKLADTGNYRCKVMSNRGPESSTVQLTVITEVPKPTCGIYGDATVGSDVRLQCELPKGIESWGFSWKKISGDGMFPRLSSLDKTRGNLSIKDLKPRDAGTYRCKAGSPVSEELCDVILQIKPYQSALLSVATTTVVFIIVAIVSVATLNITVIICCVRRIKSGRNKETWAVACRPHQDIVDVIIC